MPRNTRFAIAVLAGCALLATAAPAGAQATGSDTTTLAAPDFDSGVSARRLSDSSFNTPAADGRPGVKFFVLGVQAFRKGDYAHAADMYKVAASWAYKPAEYNLGVMYFKGQGVPVDRPRGAAWMILAAERGTLAYVKARDQMVTLLSDAQFARTDALWGQLRQTYGDHVALRRAKAQWAWARSQRTGTRVGGSVGPLLVGAPNASSHGQPNGYLGNASMLRAGFGYLPGGSVDGSVAYRQFEQSNNPYDPAFIRNPSGTVTVEPLQRVKSPVAPDKISRHPAPPSTSAGASQGFQIP